MLGWTLWTPFWTLQQKEDLWGLTDSWGEEHKERSYESVLSITFPVSRKEPVAVGAEIVLDQING